MDSETKILKFLLDKKEKFTIKKISDSLKINYRIAHERIASLEEKGLITTAKAGNSRLCELTNKFSNEIFKAEYIRRKEFLKNKDLYVLQKKLSELSFPFITILFGSHAKKQQKKGSDIDLLIICEEKREKQIQETLDLTPLKIHPTYTNFEEFIKMLKTNEFSVVSEATKNNIILLGIEEYYKMLENAQR